MSSPFFDGYLWVSPSDWDRIETLLAPTPTQEQPNAGAINDILSKYTPTKKKPKWLMKDKDMEVPGISWQHKTIVRDNQ